LARTLACGASVCDAGSCCRFSAALESFCAKVVA